jgi:hypothetical protein
MRRNIIALSLFNAAKLLREQEEVASAAPPPPPATTETSQAPAEEAVVSPSKNIPTGKGGEPLTVESMIERLNVIRAGKSFDDPEVFGQLTTLYKGLDDDMKTKVDSLLFNIGKIVQSVSDKPTTEPEAVTPPAPPAEPAAETVQAPASPAPAAPAV